ncbi:MAG: hypothetical protein RIA09_03590 [Hoeflea sp.]|uniref:hypothetical protein n=1 Tax=Hoeflea sp. TaxID=1940281 RepID=UPI0032ECE3A0
MKYAGLIEIALTFGGFMIFIIWQMRSLRRDIRAREEREAQAKAAAETGKNEQQAQER